MFIKLKNLLKKIIPASIFILCREVDRVEEQNKQTQKQLTQMQKQLTQMQMELKRQNKELVDEIRDSRTKSDKQYETLKKVSETSKRYSEEAVWAEIFNNTISNSTWLNDKTFSPGRWAVGYPAIYAIYRILNEVQPRMILELGLGQSTRIIG